MTARCAGVMRAAVAAHPARWSEVRGGTIIDRVLPRIAPRHLYWLRVAAFRDLCRRADDEDTHAILPAQDRLPTGPRSI